MELGFFVQISQILQLPQTFNDILSQLKPIIQ